MNANSNNDEVAAEILANITEGQDETEAAVVSRRKPMNVTDELNDILAYKRNHPRKARREQEAESVEETASSIGNSFSEGIEESTKTTSNSLYDNIVYYIKNEVESYLEDYKGGRRKNAHIEAEKVLDELAGISSDDYSEEAFLNHKLAYEKRTGNVIPVSGDGLPLGTTNFSEIEKALLLEISNNIPDKAFAVRGFSAEELKPLWNRFISEAL